VLPAIVLSRGCKERCPTSPTDSTESLNQIKRLVSKGAILVIGPTLWKHFMTEEQDISTEDRFHQHEIRDLIGYANSELRLWKKEDLPWFVDEVEYFEPFKFINTIFLQPNELIDGSEWVKFAFKEELVVGEYNIKIRKLSLGTKDITTTFDIPINKGDNIEDIRHQLLPLIHWCESITIFDAYSVWRHKDSLKNRGLSSGLTNFFRWIVDARTEMKMPLKRLRIISRSRISDSKVTPLFNKLKKIIENDGDPKSILGEIKTMESESSAQRDVRNEMVEVLDNLINESELAKVVEPTQKDRRYGIQLGFIGDKMGDRYLVFERGGLALTYSLGHSGFMHFESSRMKRQVQYNFNISGPLPSKIWDSFATRISNMNNQKQFIYHPFESTLPL
jgi:hypothetical protein